MFCSHVTLLILLLSFMAMVWQSKERDTQCFVLNTSLVVTMQCWSNPSKEATTWQLSLFEDPFCPLPVTGMYTQQSEKVTMNYTIAVNLLLHTFSLYKICWPFYCFSMLSKATTRTGIDIVLSVVYASLYKRCLTLNRLLSSLLLLLRILLKQNTALLSNVC